jgi:hypothetical protein
MPGFPGFPDIGAIGKAAEEAGKRSVDQHKEQVMLLTEIRDAIRALVEAMKGA